MSLQFGVPILLLSTIIQAAVLPHFRVFGGQPDLVVLVVLAWAALDDDREGMAWAFVGGGLLDLFSGAPLGISPLILVPIAYVIGVLEARVYKTNALFLVLLTIVGAAAYHVAYMILLRFLGGVPLAWAAGFWYVTVPSVLFDAVLVLPLLYVLSRLYDRLHPRLRTI